MIATSLFSSVRTELQSERIKEFETLADAGECKFDLSVDVSDGHFVSIGPWLYPIPIDHAVGLWAKKLTTSVHFFLRPLFPWVDFEAVNGSKGVGRR